MKGKSKFKNLISFLLVLMIIISTVPMSVSAAAAEKVSDATEKVGEAAKDAAASLGYMVLDAGTQLGRQNLQQASVVNEMLSDAKGAVVSAANTLGTAITRAATEGTYGDFKYRMLEDGTVEITDYIGSAKELVIPSEMNGYKVTRIGSYAFNICYSLTKVTIEDGVTTIESDAFRNCDSLISINIPNSVISIGNSVFYGCESLKNITIPDNVMSIGDYAFSYCSNLKSVQLGNGLTNLGGSAFSETNINEIEIPKSIVSMGNYIFGTYYSPFYNARQLRRIVFEEETYTIPYGALMNCSSIEEIVIPDTITVIGAEAFYGCTGLQDVNIPNGVATISDSAFLGCTNLVYITIPDSVTKIGLSAFKDCVSLTSVTFGNGLQTLGSYAFSGTSVMEIAIPYGVTELSSFPYNDSSFCGAEKLKKVIFEYGTNIIPDNALKNCTSVEEIILPDSIEEIGWYAFSNCTNLTNIKIPENVVTIGVSAFSGSGIIEITIPDSVVVLEDSFRGTKNLKKVIFKEGCRTIPEKALQNCVSVEEIVIPNNVTKIGQNAFSGCTSLIDITIPNSVEEIGSYAFSSCTSLTAITIPDSIEEIAWYTFLDCTSLTDVLIPNSVKVIGWNAFSGCTSLTDVTLPNGVKEIGSEAFSGCSSLTSIDIPESVSKIGAGAFSNCSRLENIISKGAVDGVLFQNYYVSYSALVKLVQYPAGKKSENYIVPSALSRGGELLPVREIGMKAFNGCTKLTSVTIPDSVSLINKEAFENCKNLSKVFILSNTIDISEKAFAKCESLTDIYYVGSEEDWKNNVYIGADAISNNVVIHYNYDGSIEQPDNPDYGLIHFAEPFVVLDIGETYQLHVYDKDGSEVTASMTYSSLSGGIFSVNTSGLVTAEGEGIARVNASYKTGGQTVSTECIVLVGEPSSLSYTATYDTKYYAYEGGGFYSTSSSVSDSIDLYLLMENAVSPGLDIWIDPTEYPDYFKDIKPITLTAQISGSGLSFSPDTYQSTYTATYETLSLGYAADELLSLYPMDLDLNLVGNNYTVTVTLTSESFDPITETYSFTVTSEAVESVENHLRFIAGNEDYQTLRQNIYGSSMVGLKDDREYIWSKYSTLDFDNYYDIVLADILIKILDVEQIEMPSLIPDFVKDCVSNFKTLTGGVKVVVNDSYDEVLDLSEHEVGKILKKSKYKEDDKKFTDKVYDAVLEHCGKPENNKKIESIISSMKGAGRFIDAVELGSNIIKSVVDWGNRLALLNAFSNADKAFKNVMKTFADTIPSSEYKMKESVYDYINYSQDWTGKMSEIQEITDKLLFDVSMEVLKKMIGKSFFEFVGYNVLGWLGTSTISGGTAVFASTAAFSGVSSAFGAFFTGVSLGLCLSDHLCDSSGKSEEMSKIVAMSEYSTYITNTLYYYEQKLWNDAVHATEETGSIEAAVATVDEFEYAFLLQKTSQSYIMEHTISALEKKAGSIIGRRLDRNDYPSLISEILAQKSTVDNLRCHTDSLEEPTEVTETKVIAIHCPVDVFVTGADGSELVRIVNDTVEYAAEGINVIVVDGEKYIAVPADQKFDIKIVAREAGSMSYSVTEYAEGAQRVQTVGISEITLKNGAEFNADIPQGINNSSEDYSIEENGTVILPDEIIAIPVTGIEIDKNSLNLNVGETYKLNAAVLPSDASNQNVIWYSDNPSVASVDENGMVTAVSNGQTTVYAVSEEWGYMAACTVTVSGGSIAITGDINGDGKVTAVDARWVLQIAAGTREVSETERSSVDLNKDGKVTAIDARWVLQVAAGTRKIS